MMGRLALILFLPLATNAAVLTLNGKSLVCSELRMGKAGNVLATCQPSEPSSPTQPTFPIPPSQLCVNPAGQTIVTPQNMVMQTLYMGGTNNYAIDDFNFVNPPPGTSSNSILARVTTSAPSGSIQVFAVPRKWPDGSPALGVSAFFAEWILSGLGVMYEVALSPCKGDFSYYKTPAATNTDLGIPIQPCGLVSGPNSSINWSPEGSFAACKTNAAPDATWYLNWRVVPGTAVSCANVLGGAFHTCGPVFQTSPF